MTELAERYKFAEAVVLDGYAKKSDLNGRSQKWKIDALKEDRKNGNYDSNIMREFVKDVEEKMENMRTLGKLVDKFLAEKGLPVSKSLVDSSQ